MLERGEIERAVRAAGGKIGKAAKLLGASRRTLQNRMRFYGMKRGAAGRPKRKLSYRRRRVAWGVGAVAVGALAGIALVRHRGNST